MYGGDRCRVACACGLDLQCVIRKKFRGHRRGNVNRGLLVGLRLRGAQPPTLRPARGLPQGRGRPPQPRAIDTACWNDAALAQPMGGQGEEWGIGIIQRTRSLLQRCTRRRGGSARADSRGWRGCPRAYTHDQ
jgi:hypothetical protein